MVRRFARLVAAVLAVATGCGDGEPRPLRWVVEFDPPELRDRVVVMAFAVREDGCAGTANAYEAEVADGETAPRPPVLPPGSYGLVAEARDADCVVFAARCTPVTFPHGEDQVVLSLSVTPERPACATESCLEGFCRATELDAGPSDAGVDSSFDAGPVDILPSNVDPAVSLDDGSAEPTIGASGNTTWIADTDTGQITGYTPAGGRTIVRVAGSDGDATGIAFRAQPAPSLGAPPLGIFVFGSLTVPDGAELIGTGSAALVVLARGAVSIDGTISVAANAAAVHTASAPGAGGGAGGVGSANGVAPSADGTGLGGGRAAGMGVGSAVDPGGGGGGFGTSGGAGGDAGGAGGGVAGAVYGDESLVPLRGGSGGGTGGTPAGDGGHGGGALQIVSGLAILLGPSGAIDACGGGGSGGLEVNPTTLGGGSGAGSGGGILLEAPAVVLSGAVAANGGGGGGGAIAGAPRADGADGDARMLPAPGGASADPTTAGAGGDGSDASGMTGPGAPAMEAGGGGGGAGRIRVNTRNGTETYATVTPTHASGLTTVGTITAR